jgi:hypothetical protein
MDSSVWFQFLFGFLDGYKNERNEKSGFEKNKAHFVYTPETGILSSIKNAGEAWHAGRFTTQSLDKLRASQRPLSAREMKPGTTTVRFVSGDVAILHGDPEYAGATFLTSSNFNCLQHEGWESDPDLGVATYWLNNTQGASCAMSCAPGTIVRHYFAQAEPQINTLKKVIESLSGVGKRQLVDVSRGYISFADLVPLSTIIGGLSTEERETTKGLLEVGIQENTEVTCTKLATNTSMWCRVVRKDPALRVTQVFAGSDSFQHDPKWGPLASLVFEAAYEATLHVAANASSGVSPKNPENPENRTVVLTALCGEYAPRWLSAVTTTAIVSALAKFKNEGLDVVINEPTEGAYVSIRLALDENADTRSLVSQSAFSAALYTE